MCMSSWGTSNRYGAHVTSALRYLAMSAYGLDKCSPAARCNVGMQELLPHYWEYVASCQFVHHQVFPGKSLINFGWNGHSQVQEGSDKLNLSFTGLVMHMFELLKPF